MKKNVIALAVAAAMVPGFAAAEGATISGFTDITWTHDAVGAVKDTNIFAANAEVDIRNTVGAVTVGVDMDVNLGGTAGAALQTDEFNLEQAFFAWGAAENVTVIAGLFNNPIGLDGGDAPDQPTTQTGLIAGALDAATALHVGNNISGLAVAYNAGVATVTGALLNEVQAGSTADEDNSYALIINASPMEGLDLELGYVTMDGAVQNLGDSALDVNASYDFGMAKVTAEILDVDAWNDALVGVGVYAGVADGANVGLRYETNDNIDQEQTNLVGSYELADSLTVLAGYNMVSTGNTDDDQIVIEFIAKF